MRVPVARALAALAVLTCLPVAHADLDETGRAIDKGIGEFFYRVKDAKARGALARSAMSNPPEECFALIERGQRAGIAPTEEMAKGSDHAYLWKRAASQCEEYRTWKRLVDAAVILEDARNAHVGSTSQAAGSVSGEWAAGYGEHGQACLVAIDAMIKDGLATDVPVQIAGDPLTVAAARAQYCQGLVDWAKGFAVETERVRAEVLAAIRGKYTKHGIGGDRLTLLVENDDTYFHGKGCSGGISDVKVLKTAKLLFYWTEKSTGGWGLRRYQFKGDKLVKESYREFDRLDSAYRWCK